MEIILAFWVLFMSLVMLACAFFAGRHVGRDSALERLEESLRSKWMNRGASVNTGPVSMVFGGFKITGTVTRT